MQQSNKYSISLIKALLLKKKINKSLSQSVYNKIQQSQAKF